jgi:ABC-type transport system involved in multi-copper enzyme maturation permease subunit
MVLAYAGINLITGIDANDPVSGTLFGANAVIGSVYSLTNNIGLIIPAFAGVLVCTDYSNGTLRNKIIAGNRRSHIYFSHLIVSIIFAVAIITIYAAVTTGLALLMLPFNRSAIADLGTEIMYFTLYGTMTFVFMATVATLFSMVFRAAAPTIIFTIVVSIVLLALNSLLMLADYEKYKYLVYFIPTFASNFFNLGSFSIAGLLSNAENTSTSLIFAEGMLSYLFFSVVNTVIGLLVFKKRDVK